MVILKLHGIPSRAVWFLGLSMTFCLNLPQHTVKIRRQFVGSINVIFEYPFFHRDFYAVAPAVTPHPKILA